MIAEIKTLTEYKNCEKTLQNAIPCVGVGLHSGVKVHMTMRPTLSRTVQRDTSTDGTIMMQKASLQKL